MALANDVWARFWGSLGPVPRIHVTLTAWLQSITRVDRYRTYSRACLFDPSTNPPTYRPTYSPTTYQLPFNTSQPIPITRWAAASHRNHQADTQAQALLDRITQAARTHLQRRNRDIHLNKDMHPRVIHPRDTRLNKDIHHNKDTVDSREFHHRATAVGIRLSNSAWAA